MTENQKLREALQVAHDHIDMWSLEISHCKDAALIREALALPTSDQNLYLDGVNVERLKRAMSVAGCSADPSLEGLAADLSSHINRLTAAVVNRVKTAAPVGELPELPEPTWSTGLGVAFTADQMRAYALSALSAGDAVDAQRYRWLMQFETWPEEVETAIDLSSKPMVDAAIDAAMRKGQL